MQVFAPGQAVSSFGLSWFEYGLGAAGQHVAGVERQRSVDKTGKPIARHAQTTDTTPRVTQSDMTPTRTNRPHGAL